MLGSKSGGIDFVLPAGAGNGIGSKSILSSMVFSTKGTKIIPPAPICATSVGGMTGQNYTDANKWLGSCPMFRK